ncbi:ImmA/IrrE family metallo-endopeptidase [Psychrobacillus sp.]|uniref:ImmA/IrrE family metallo-endopeptidase n=1 Tax=Psychrobacillus sp. TaxID=1871623 RepID=UPI0028BDE8B7|nr:ImmA/IrrE family metallo-endopeptidase [Psychrobacillus sp.]
MVLEALKIKVDTWEELAEKVLSNFKYGSPDEIDIEDICWKYGIKIKPLDIHFAESYLESEDIGSLKSFALPSEIDRRGTIFLKPGLNAIERKLLLAEEFCHIYAHHSSQIEIDICSINKLENQARRMSAYLLMPYRFVQNIYNMALDQPVLISHIADYFVVSEEFAQYRIELIFNRKIDAIFPIRGKLGAMEWLE